MPKPDRRREPFAETVARTAHEIPPAGEGWVSVPPITDREWTDDHGVWWSLRCLLNAKQARRAIGDPAVEVIEFYLDELTTVPIADRAAYLSKIRPYLEGLGPQTANDHTNYRAAEFRAPDRRRLVIVERSC